MSKVIDAIEDISKIDGLGAISKPLITYPVNGAVDFIGEVTATYNTGAQYVGTQNYVLWEAGNSDFSTIYDSYEGSSNLLSWTPSIGMPLTTAYVRVKQGSDNNRSMYSDVITFTTPNIYIITPTLTVTGTPSDVPETPTLTTSAFSVHNGSDTHVSTDWEIRLSANDTLVWSSVGNTVNKLSIIVPSGKLQVGTAYVFKAKHNGTTYGSSAYVSVSGTTKATFSLAYGVDWDEVNDTYTRTGVPNYTYIQAQMKRCVLNANGTVNYYLHPTDSTKKADGSAADLTGASGNVMVEIPKFYYKHSKTGNVTSISITPTPEAGYKLHPAFIRAGVEKNYRYYCAYEGYTNGSTLISRSGVAPTRSKTIATFRTEAAANGTGWSQVDWNLLYAVQLLFVTEFASFKTQEILGNGNDTGSDYAMTTGGSNAIGNASSPATNDDTWMSYRGIENWYGNAFKFIDGINIQVRSIYLNTTNNPATYASDTFSGAYSDTGVDFITTSGYISGMQNADVGFIPSAVVGSSSTKVPDYFYGTTGTGNYIVIFGGNADIELYCGGFSVNSIADYSTSYTIIGSGVSF